MQPASLLASAFLLFMALPAQTVDELVARLAKAESLDDEAIGIAGTKSETFRTYEQLRDRATREQLTKLLDHDSAIVRGYAFRALADRSEEVDWPALLALRAADTAKVITFRGCERIECMFGDAVIELARDRKLLTDEQWLDLAELLVKQKSQLDARNWALRNLKFRDGMLHTLRALAAGGDGAAHVALARFRIAKDLPLLTAWLSRPGAFDDTTAFLAAQQFPDASLLPALIALEPSARAKIAEGLPHRLREWFGAFAAQRTAGATAFLVRFLQQTPPEERVRHRQIVELLREVVAPAGGEAVLAPLREELAKHTRK